MKYVKQMAVCAARYYYLLQSQKAVNVYITSKQILSLGFAWNYDLFRLGILSKICLTVL